MSWQKVKQAFFVEKGMELQWIDIAVCSNCNGIHIPPEEANGCQPKDTITYEQLKERIKLFNLKQINHGSSDNGCYFCKGNEVHLISQEGNDLGKIKCPICNN